MAQRLYSILIGALGFLLLLVFALWLAGAPLELSPRAEDHRGPALAAVALIFGGLFGWLFHISNINTAKNKKYLADFDANWRLQVIWVTPEDGETYTADAKTFDNSILQILKLGAFTDPQSQQYRKLAKYSGIDSKRKSFVVVAIWGPDTPFR